MNFEFSESQGILRDSVRRFLEKSAPLDPYVRDMLGDSRGTSDEVWRGLAGLGAPGLLIPEAYGGAGLGMLEMGIVCEELGRLVHPGPLLSSALGAAPLIAALADEAMRRELLPALASGESVATLALHEPGHRYDWRAPRATARRRSEGWRLSGVKSSVFDAAAADLVLVVARPEDEAGPGVFAVEARDLAIEPQTGVDGTRKAAHIALRDAPAERLGTGDATPTVAAALDRWTLGWVADGVGAAQRAFELAHAYAQERVQFDRPIGSFQAVQHLLVDMLQDLELGRAGTWYALWAADQADEAECHRTTAMAKAFASRAFPRIGADAIQIFGGVGFTWEYDVHLYYKRLLSLQHALGDEGEHLDELARIAIDYH